MTKALERPTKPFEYFGAQTGQSRVSAVTAVMRAMHTHQARLTRMFEGSALGSDIVGAAINHTFETTRYWAAASMTSQVDKLRLLKESDPYGHFPDDVRRGMEGCLNEALEDAERSDSFGLPVLEPSTLFVATTALALERYQVEDDIRAREAQDVITSSLPQAWAAAGQPEMPELIMNHVAHHPELLQ
jgi:hypothetical protein